ncbi:MAG: glycosyltransferase family 4 protein [Rhizobacter sp.]|nr:glycosyltransferase family 4 protein [Rhizobacter sp.]
MAERSRVAYLINHYPAVSHSFIRREILALERQGIAVERIALRGWDGALADPEDERERARTRFVLREGALGVLGAVIAEALARPVAFLCALRLATRMSAGSDRSLVYHWIYCAEACVVARWMRAASLDHIHAHFGTNSAEVAMLAGELAPAAYSMTVHGPDEFDRARAIGLAEKIRRASFVVAVSSFTRSQLFRWVEWSHWDKVHVVHCGLDRGFHAGASPPSGAARRLVCVGRLGEQKGHLLLLAAMRRAFERGCVFDLVLAGDGELRGEIEQRVRALGLHANVRITGWIGSADVRAEIEAARALVLPSFAEGLPVVIMEAMALRRPVVTTFVAGIPELVLPGETGWLVPAGDVDALAAALVACVDASEDTIAAMGARARERVLELHDVDVEAGKLGRLLRLRPSRATR